MLSCAWMRVSVFVGHSRLQARLHLAAIKLHASRTPLHSSTAGSCFKASLHKTNWEHLTAWWLRLAGLTSANYLAIKCGCVRWNVSMVKMLTNRRDERKEDDRKQKREMESWSERWDEGCNVMTVAEKRLPGMKKKKRSENVSKLFCFSVSFLRFRTVHFRQTSHQNTFVNTTVVSMFCQGERATDQWQSLSFSGVEFPDDNMTVIMAEITDMPKPPPGDRSLDAKSQSSPALLRGT